MAISVTLIGSLPSATALKWIFPAYNQSAGNCIVLAFALATPTAIPPGNITDTAGNTYTSAVGPTGSNTPVQIFICKNCKGNAANIIQAVASANGQFSPGWALDVSGVDTSNPVDVATTGSASSATPSLTITTAKANEAIIFIGVAGAGYTTGSAGANYTGDGNNGQGGNQAFVQHRVTSSILTSQAQSYGISPTTSVNMALVSLIGEHSISGSAGVAGALVSYSGTASGSVTADGSGNYTIPSLLDGPYTITPSLLGYSFSPASQNETLSGSDITGVNFTATHLTVATPSLSVPAGTYASPQIVTVTDTDHALGGFAMYYTTDGSTPTSGSTPIANGGTVTISVSQTLKVIAEATGYINSNVASNAYVIASYYSVPDCRKAPFGPNSSRTSQGTVIYDVQTSSNSAVPPTDSRAAGAPADSRVNKPTNSRTPGTYGPGE